ncbi:hypothetical protein RhiirA1_449890 [Rhizophagus irregularis]|uniref:Uncharacterized protein n=1 Tax=Rhizophagus irregularis TaxID=588596 RepID=A0A2N0SG47_9GLOM|nr:hypothetical protein RhiirA1_449890 [Rhizophagus irregularis]
MNNLKQNLAKLAKKFCNKEIPDFNELFHENPTTDDLEKLICIESVIEQQEICLFSKFNTKELKQAAHILDEFYFCLEETLNRFIPFVNKNHKSENLIKVLIWKKILLQSDVTSLII